MTFQASIQSQPAFAVAGDIATLNPQVSIVAMEGQFVAATGGVNVGSFAWFDRAAGTAGYTTTAPNMLAFVPRGLNGLITTFLAETNSLIPAGYAVQGIVDGDVWCKVTVANATAGQKAFAKNTDGSIQPAAAGATVSGYTETQWYFTMSALIGEVAVISTRQQ